MEKEMFGFSNRLKNLREKLGITQSELARRLSLTRSSVNSWEMGIAVPSTPFIVELARLFSVTTDYLLGLDENMTIHTDGLSEREISLLLDMLDYFHRDKR